jgi:hypothetical protein
MLQLLLLPFNTHLPSRKRNNMRTIPEMPSKTQRTGTNLRSLAHDTYPNSDSCMSTIMRHATWACA